MAKDFVMQSMKTKSLIFGVDWPRFLVSDLSDAYVRRKFKVSHVNVRNVMMTSQFVNGPNSNLMAVRRQRFLLDEGLFDRWLTTTTGDEFRALEKMR